PGRAQALEPVVLARRPGQHGSAAHDAGDAARIRDDQEEAADRGTRGSGVLPRPLVSRVRLALAIVFVTVAMPALAQAQVFIASRPHPGFEIGPLFIRATVTPELGPVPIDVTWSVSVPANHTATDLEQDMTLLWPGALVHDGKGERDAALVKYVSGHGFKVTDGGRVEMFAINQFGPPGQRRQPIAAGAHFVSFVRES